ncbi:MAG: FtsQ-type POTRA domain-containing protein [Candidatus Aureabacteria bacterium]|nr:FtsQ-type POTRA domain-containing protein [Candidatus Auribacterota bacterium]
MRAMMDFRKLIGRGHARRARNKRTIVFNVDVARRRRSRAEYGEGRSRGTLAGIALAATVVLLIAGTALAPRVLKPAGFSVRWIDVRTSDLLTRAEVIALSGLRVGDNLLTADLGRIRRAICAHPDVKDAAVSRTLPGRVSIRVYERYPVAAVHVPSSPRAQGASTVRRYVIDEEGCVLSVKKELRNRALPLLLGLTIDVARPGERLRDPMTQKALEIIKGYRDTGLCRQIDLVSVDVSDPENYLLRSASIQEIRLGAEQLTDRLQLLSYILKQRGFRGMELPAAYLDLRWKDVAELPLGREAISMK